MHRRSGRLLVRPVNNPRGQVHHIYGAPNLLRSGYANSSASNPGETEITELLFRLPRRRMSLVSLFDESEAFAQFRTNQTTVVTHYFQSAALSRPLNAKRPYDDMTLGSNGPL